MDIPEDVRRRWRERVESGHNPGKTIWVERHAEGHWLIHANTPRDAARRMQVALDAGHAVFADPGSVK